MKKILLVLVLASTAFGGIPVIDYSNLMQNTTTALKQVAAYAKQVEQYQTQLLQYKNQLLNTLGIGQAAQIWQQAQGTMNQVRGVLNMFQNGGGLQGYMQNLQDVNYWLSAPASQYGYKPDNYWSTTQKTALDEMVQEISQQQRELNADAQTLQRLQGQAGSTEGQKQALDVANEMAALQQKQLMEIRALLIAEQQALAARSGAVTNKEAMQEAATQQLFYSPYTYQDHSAWSP